jgi:hypothetical protein
LIDGIVTCRDNGKYQFVANAAIERPTDGVNGSADAAAGLTDTTTGSFEKAKVFDTVVDLLDTLKFAGVFPPNFEYKANGRHYTHEKGYKMQKKFPGLVGVAEDPQVKQLPPLVWHVEINCAHLKVETKPCHAYLKLASASLGSDLVEGPDGQMYAAVFIQFCRTSRQLRLAAKLNFTLLLHTPL